MILGCSGFGKSMLVLFICGDLWFILGEIFLGNILIEVFGEMMIEYIGVMY